MRRKNQRLLAVAIFLALVGIFLAVSFQFVDNHRWYWNAAPTLSALVVLLAASAGFLLAHSISAAHERRPWLLVPGGILGLAWFASGIAAFGLAFPAMNYFSPGDAYIGWDSYHGDYVVGMYHIRLLQLAMVTGFLGGFFVSKALQKWIAESREIGSRSYE